MSDMQRRHFELIAETIRELPDYDYALPRETLALRFADKLARTNPNLTAPSS